MAEVQYFSSNYGTQVRTSFSKCTYIFSWLIENYPKWPSTASVNSPEFHLVEHRTFYGTLSSKDKSSDLNYSFTLKSGKDIVIEHDISITDRSGFSFWAFSKKHNYNDSANRCEFPLSSGAVEKYSNLTKDQVLIIKCTMTFDKFCTESGREYRIVTPSDNLSALVDNLKAMYTTSLHADIDLKVEDSVVRVHKSLLCARSSVFAKMFSSPMEENESNVINVTDIKLPVLKDLLEFLYTGHLREDDFESVYALYYAADKYDVPSLRKTCSDVLLSEMGVGNACSVLSLANRHSDVQFKDSVMDFVEFYFDDILETKAWDELLEDETKLAAEDPDTKSFSCYAVSEALGETIVQTYTVAVVYPPSNPVISGYEEGKPVKAGDLQKFTCISTGGNPQATLKWFKKDKELRGAEKSTQSGTTSDLVIRAEASDNGAAYRCEATNSALKQPLVANVTPSVLFPPASVTIKLKPRKPKAGDVVTLTCETASSNPESTVLWWKDGESITGHHEGVVDASYGGKSTRNRVRFNVTSGDDMSTYTCQATNHILRRTVHDSFVLRVLYKPEFLLPPAERFDVLEGESTVVNATAKANPTQVTYSWTRNGLPLLDMADGGPRPGPGARYGHRAVYRGPLLELSDVTRDDGGEYGCEAANTEGVTWTSVNINVIYPARITKLTRTAVAGSGETATFECLAVANPFVSRMLEWRRTGFDMSRTRETVEKGRSLLDVLNVTRQDAGTFECVAYNGIGEEASQAAQLIVKFKPEVRLPHGFVDVAGAEGEAARLVCLAEGAPAIGFAWSYGGAVLGGDGGFSGSKYASQAAQLDGVTWESVLFVKHLQAGDFGQYTCVARNELGHDHVKVRLRRRGPPDPPYNIRIVNTSSDSVVLSWTPGYSSGMPQQFRVRYHVSGSKSEGSASYTDVFPTNTTVFAVAGLEPEKEYAFALSARNMLGESLYSKENTRAITQKWNGGVHPTGASSSLDALSDKNAELPRLLLVVVCVVGSLLLVLNVVLVVCFVKRRKNRNGHARGSPKALTQTTTPDSLMYTPSKYQQTINGEAICQLDDKDSYQEEILMKELYEAKKQVTEKCLPGYQTASPYDLSQARKKDNCPDILKNRGMDHVSLQSVPLSDITTLSDDNSRYSRRGILLPPEDNLATSPHHRTRTPPQTTQDSCVLGSVGTHIV